MKKVLTTFTTLTIVLIVLAAFTGCGGSKVPERLTGQWQCAATASDETTDTSFYVLKIDEDGTFSLKDTTGATAGISGTMKGDDTGKLGILELTCDEDSFEPPSCWAKLQNNSRIRYKIISEDTIRLGYVGIWLIFTK